LWATYVALAADHLVAVVLGGKGLERRLNDTTTETENQVESGFLDMPVLVECCASTVYLNLPCACLLFFPSLYRITDFFWFFLPHSKAYLLDVVVAEGAAILELLASEDQTLLVRGNTLLVLDLGLDIVDGVAGLHLKGDSLAGEGLDEAGRLC